MWILEAAIPPAPMQPLPPIGAEPPVASIRFRRLFPTYRRSVGMTLQATCKVPTGRYPHQAVARVSFLRSPTGKAGRVFPVTEKETFLISRQALLRIMTVIFSVRKMGLPCRHAPVAFATATRTWLL